MHPLSLPVQDYHAHLQHVVRLGDEQTSEEGAQGEGEASEGGEERGAEDDEEGGAGKDLGVGKLCTCTKCGSKGCGKVGGGVTSVHTWLIFLYNGWMRSRPPAKMAKMQTTAF
jgi:hypothetical protein